MSRAPIPRVKGEQVAIAAGGAAGLAIGAAAYARWIEPRWIETTRTRIAWPGPLLRLALLTDLHAAWAGRRVIARAIDRVQNARVDLVLLGGDYVASSEATREDLEALAPVAALRPRVGVFAVLGNHDVKGRDAIVRRLWSLGVTVLENEARAIGRDARLVALGSHRAGRTDARRAFAEHPRARATIVLAHNWQSLRADGVAPFDVAFAGHTHGGQGCVPGTTVCPPLEPDMPPFVRGLHRWPAGGWLYVSRGVGESGMRARFGSRPEVTLIDLVPTLSA